MICARVRRRNSLNSGTSSLWSLAPTAASIFLVQSGSKTWTQTWIGDGPWRSGSTLVAGGEAVGKGADQSFFLLVGIGVRFIVLFERHCAGALCPLVAE